MDELKVSINKLITELEEKFTMYSKLTSASDKEKELGDIDKILDQAEDGYSMFEKQMSKAKNGKQMYGEDAEYFDEKLGGFRQKFTQLRTGANNPSGSGINTSTHIKGDNTNVAQSIAMVSKIAEGDKELAKGKEKIENIKRGLKVINEELTGIEEEIEKQRERLELIQNKIDDSSSVLKQSQKVLNGISKMLYHDTLLKVLIVFIIIAIVGIIAVAVVVKMGNSVENAYVDEEDDGTENNFDDIDEFLFMKVGQSSVEYDSEGVNSYDKFKIV